MNAHGGERKKLTHARGYSDHSLTWSTDGSTLAFVRQEEKNAKRSAIFTVKTSGKSETAVTDWAQYRAPSWSPDGNELVYEKYREDESMLLITNLGTNTERVLTTLSENVDSKAAWSPNGKKILYKDSSK